MKTVPVTYRAFARIDLPDGDQIVLVTGHRFGDVETLHDVNHNCYRHDKQGGIIWQVQRDDSNYPADWWDGLHRHAREQGSDGAREPFMEFMLEYADGTNNKNALEILPDIARWVPRCKIWLRGSAYQQYVLDPETGIAKNVTDWPVRPW
jgi:hypothetical protein